MPSRSATACRGPCAAGRLSAWAGGPKVAGLLPASADERMGVRYGRVRLPQYLTTQASECSRV